ncbi:MAG: alpha-1,2-fucosyltransferase [Bacteroidales bacterium]|nr:alpha-1,2-fucosyltransferase [Bacteroidales bacterium]
MKIISFSGGLGNQIFEYANYLRLRRLFPNERFFGLYTKSGLKDHNGLEIEKCFQIELPSCSFLSNVLGGFVLFLYKIFQSINVNLPFAADRLHKNDNALLHTGWFGDNKFLPNDFDISFKIKDLSLKNKQIIETLTNHITLSIHIRRGDFTTESNQKQYGNICTEHYYQSAISEVLKYNEDITILIFSDDAEYVRKTYNLPNSIIVDWNTKENSYLDMYLMSKCDYMIIANSTFSYWAAKLNKKAKKIFCPSKWLNNIDIDIYPDNWHKIEV